MVTIEAARRMREQTETAILDLLRALQKTTGLDLVGVSVSTMVCADEPDGEPQRKAMRVRIDLAV